MEIILSNGQTVKVPEGANPITFRLIEESRLQKLANPTKAKPKRKAGRRDGHSKRSQYAAMQSAIGRATLGLVSRVNGIPFDGSATESPDEITGRDYYGV